MIIIAGFAIFLIPMWLKKQITKISKTSVPTIAQSNIGRGSRVSQTQEELAEAVTDKIVNKNRKTEKQKSIL